MFNPFSKRLHLPIHLFFGFVLLFKTLRHFQIWVRDEFRSGNNASQTARNINQTCMDLTLRNEPRGRLEDKVDKDELKAIVGPSETTA